MCAENFAKCQENPFIASASFVDSFYIHKICIHKVILKVINNAMCVRCDMSTYIEPKHSVRTLMEDTFSSSLVPNEIDHKLYVVFRSINTTHPRARRHGRTSRDTRHTPHTTYLGCCLLYILYILVKCRWEFFVNT